MAEEDGNDAAAADAGAEPEEDEDLEGDAEEGEEGEEELNEEEEGEDESEENLSQIVKDKDLQSNNELETKLIRKQSI